MHGLDLGRKTENYCTHTRVLLSTAASFACTAGACNNGNMHVQTFQTWNLNVNPESESNDMDLCSRCPDCRAVRYRMFIVKTVQQRWRESLTYECSIGRNQDTELEVNDSPSPLQCARAPYPLHGYWGGR